MKLFKSGIIRGMSIMIAVSMLSMTLLSCDTTNNDISDGSTVSEISSTLSDDSSDANLSESLSDLSMEPSYTSSEESPMLSDSLSSESVASSSSNSAPSSSISSSVPSSSSMSLSVSSSTVVSASDSSSEESPQMVTTRLDTYEKFLQKAQSGEPVNVAFLGGSITAGASYANWGQGDDTFIGTNLDGTPIDTTEYWSYPSSDDMRGSWRYRVFEWLMINYQTEENQFKQINAAIGGTNSDFGALRLEDHVFAQGIPDIIFIEYAVNDNGRAAYNIRESYESIVSRVKEQNPDCAIFVALSPSRQKKDAANPGFYDVVLSICDITREYADFRKIPYANIDDAFYHGSLTETQKTALYYGPQSSFGYQVHPSPYGYEIYAGEVVRVLQSCFDTLEFDFNVVEMDAPVPYPLNSRIIFGEDLLASMPGSVSVKLADDPRQHKCLSYHRMLVASSLNNELSYSFEGTGLSLWLDLGYTNYRVDIYIDDILTYSNWGLESSQVKLLSKFLTPDTTHVLRIVPKSAADSGKPFNFGLRGIIISN